MHATPTKEQVKARFYKFVSFRNKFCLWLSIIIFVAYYGFIAGIGFFPQVLGLRLGDSAISLGILMGVSIIALCIVSTGVYTLFANKYFDKEQGEILEEMEDLKMIEEMQK
ncbi:DUF485 domain-containing protein [Helicobacter saguini]|uniref:DUF485 domain-containing protein n=1 Tax=Helicobacter saguini TaxID=1548018 RepID=A0A099BI05_9HELI|nr:DUF485 domain-containing protein [Helicobacter saguini]MWV63199.1 DUF485 domain-containing protein [Helicobacter saguini]MWV66131.1 DUF485 domain-containing protein [Helicobacter saguini]MWV68481.1 DUF485 domain-containing protein [Helicobacter saguini]MWV71965.1 DUF485 domain-containing protein [Helicobacter saguini]TLD95972.1 DUF485 domain-containing protein [Helicobacter saguini]